MSADYQTAHAQARSLDAIRNGLGTHAFAR